MVQKTKSRFALFESPDWSLLTKPESKLNHDTRKFFADRIDSAGLIKHKKSKVNLKLQHRKVFELSLAVTLVLMLTIFQIGRHQSFASVPSFSKTVDLKIEVADIPATRQFRRPQPPTDRPSMPVPTGVESIPEDVTIATTELDFADIPLAPPRSEDDGEPEIFVVYDEPPEIIGGFAAIRKYLKYPHVAQTVGIVGTVFLRALVGVDGRTERMEIIKAKPENMGFEKAAMEAVKEIRWKPARQRDKNVRVWVSIPVRFSMLRS